MKWPSSRVICASSLSLGLVVGCATMATDPMLENARLKVAQVQVNDQAVKYAQPDIVRAQQLLYAADKASRDGYTELARHDAYLANQIACVAEQTGYEHAALDRIARGESERQQIRLEARDREVSVEHAHAQMAEQRAQNAEVVADQATAQARELQSELAGLNAQQTDRGLVVKFGDVLFDTDKASLKPGASRALDQLAQMLSAHPARRVLAEGHTDSVGSDEHNIDLSTRRAAALKEALVQRGVSGDRIEVSGMGKEGAVASNDNSGGRQLNRRVEVIISDETGNFASR
jgi:outer membrane protein OmpA-like peptidoglycan-associated protein